MAQGMTSVGGGPEATVLKVGYLDLTQPDLCGRLAAFESNGFDAVVVGEGSLNYVNDFLTEVATGVAPVSACSMQHVACSMYPNQPSTS